MMFVPLIALIDCPIIRRMGIATLVSCEHLIVYMV